jgi:hypothetical protein
MTMLERSSLGRTKGTTADMTAPLRQASQPIAILRSPANNCAQKVNGIVVKDTCSFSNKVESLLCELLSRCVDERRYSGIKCLNNFESLLTSHWKPTGLWQYAWDY